jgi:hypothetical protein
MPGTVTVDIRSTFSAMILMSVSEKMQFGTAIPETTKDGERKYTVELACTYHAEPNSVMKPVSEVISVTVTGGDHNAILGIMPGSVVSLERLRCGVSAPEKRDDGRVRGGRLYWMAAGIRQVAVQKAA